MARKFVSTLAQVALMVAMSVQSFVGGSSIRQAVARPELPPGTGSMHFNGSTDYLLAIHNPPLNNTIHQLNECVGVADIEPLKDTYKYTLKKLLS